MIIKEPVWRNETTSKIKTKNRLCKQYIMNSRYENEFVFIECLISKINKIITSTKELYYKILANGLNNPMLQAKIYWSILKTIYNNNKIPIIPPFLIDSKFLTDIKTKANIFNKFFADQCTPLKNGSVLPTSKMLLTQSRLCTLNFNEEEIIKIIRNLNVHKAHGHDNISIRMIKICDKSILKSLIILFKNSTKSS